MVTIDKGAQAAIERILDSATFRNSETLRRLLRFLADKSFEGTASQLKEYSIGIDALGKPPNYDPRQDSIVRIHVGRLRQKLNEYYRTEGKDESVIVGLPKGHFELEFEEREQALPEVVAPVPDIDPVTPVVKPGESTPKRRRVSLLLVALTLTTIWAVWSTSRLLSERRESMSAADSVNPEIRELWGPFLNTGRPLIISAASPLFVGMQGAGFYRDLSLNTWSEVQNPPKAAAIRKALGNPTAVERFYYTGIGDADALFSLGRILAGGKLNVSMTHSQQLSWQQMTDNNVVMIGAPRFFGSVLKGLPTDLEYSLEEDGIRVLHPKPGQPSLLRDHYPSITGDAGNAVRDSGDVHALITRTPGPLGRSDIISFCSNHSPGTLAAVDWFTKPDLVRILAAKIRKPNGKLPQFYQLVLKVRYQDAVPTDVSLVDYRELQSAPAR